jgi:ribosomal protein L39E
MAVGGRPPTKTKVKTERKSKRNVNVPVWVGKEKKDVP